MLYVEIDLKKLKNNIEEIIKTTGKEIIPIIKSNAYGLGDIEIARHLKKAGIKLMAVVDIQEAMHLVNAKIEADILILNGVDSSDYYWLNQHKNIVVTVNSLEEAENLNAYFFTRPIKVHFQIDTGMNRLGFCDVENFDRAYRLISANSTFIPEGIYTHFTDEKNHQYQEEKFIEFLNGKNFKYIHCAATSTYHFSQAGNFLRIGLDLYGTEDKTQQIIKIITKPLAIKKVKKGETVGYDRAYQANKDEFIAVLPIGYYNGYRRSLAGFPVLVNGKRYPTIGKVCMNHLFVKVDASITLDNEFIITSSELPISEMARYLNTIPHEILCMFNITDKKYIGG